MMRTADHAESAARSFVMDRSNPVITVETKRNRKWLSVILLGSVLCAVMFLLMGAGAAQHAARGDAREAAVVMPAAEQFAAAQGVLPGSSLAVSDVMTNAPGTFRFGVAGDLGGTGAAARTFEALAKDKPDFFLAIGDLSYDDIAPEKAWCDYVKRLLGDKYPFEVLIGNHEELPSSKSGFIDNFAKCLPDRLGEVGRYAHRYYFDYPAADPIARFILIDPDLPRGEADAEYCRQGDKSNCNWLKKSIDEAQSKGLWTIVSMHKVCLTVGEKPCDVGAELLNVLLERKVDLVLQGHDHGFQRSHQLSLGPDCPALEPDTFNAGCVADQGSSGSFSRGAGTIFYISAAFGQDPYALNPDDPEMPYMATWMDRKNESKGYMQFTVAKDRIEGEFINVEGPLTDTITIRGEAVVPTPTPAATPDAGATPKGLPTSTPTPSPELQQP